MQVEHALISQLLPLHRAKPLSSRTGIPPGRLYRTAVLLVVQGQRHHSFRQPAHFEPCSCQGRVPFQPLEYNRITITNTNSINSTINIITGSMSAHRSRGSCRARFWPATLRWQRYLSMPSCTYVQADGPVCIVTDPANPYNQAIPRLYIAFGAPP